MDIAAERLLPTPLSNSVLLPLLLISLARQRHTPHPSTDIKDEYDFIVVGGGAAGSVVAGRLSEVPCVSVLLLEAGPEPPVLTEVPALTTYFRDTHLDWNFTTVPQKYTARGLVNRQIGWNAGKMLGGSGSLNGMAYVRGNRKNYDDWAEQGANGWSYKDVFPYFLKLEDYRIFSSFANGYHAVGGPITVEQPRYITDLKTALVESIRQLGYPFVDPSAKSQIGFFDVQANIRDSQRCSSVKGYLVPAENRTNLDILLDAMVTKVIIENDQATGVEFYHEGQIRRVRANREVIVSAGTVNTPKILMLSGVGPREELEKFNIPVVTDIPVGKNFHDHSSAQFLFTLNPSILGLDDKISDPSNILKFINTRTGVLASTDTLLIGFMNYENSSATKEEPDYEIYFGENSNEYTKTFGLKPEFYNQLFGPYEGKPVFRCTVQQLNPKSRGTVTLSSRNPFDPPVIDPNYLEDLTDEQDIIEGLKACKKILNTPPLIQLGARPFETLIPGCEEYAGNDEEYFRCQARTILFTAHHPAGTCKMGDPEDATTVVDSKLRVKNIKGLRVVDSSIMPSVTTGNTYIPTVMIGEKAADMIKSCITCSPENSRLQQSTFDAWNFGTKSQWRSLSRKK